MSLLPDLERALTNAIARDVAASPVPRRLWPQRRGARLGVVLGALVLAGGVAGAASLLNSTELAANSIACYPGTSFQASSMAAISANGRSPEQACARTPGTGMPAKPLIACAGGPGPNVSVFVADGRGQCEKLGLSPLPASYASARAKVSALGRSLIALYQSRDCVPLADFARRAQTILRQQGWAGWHVRVGSQDRPCGAIGFTGGGKPDITGSLVSDRHELLIDATVPRSEFKLLTALAPALTAASGRHCFSTTALSRYARRVIATHGAAAAIAVTQTPAGVSFDGGRQARYEHGCAIVTDVEASPTAGMIDVWINQIDAPKPPVKVGNAYGILPSSWYR